MSDMCKARQILGVDLGGTKTALIAGDSSGQVLGRCEFPTEPGQGYPAWLGRMREAYCGLRTSTAGWIPAAAGISAGGPADWKAGILLSPPNLPSWSHVPIRDDVSAVTGVPCRMEHDGRAGALAEHKFGAGRGHRNMVFLTFGTGIGAGIILNGRVYRGAAGSAGEIGHVRIADDGPEAYGKKGSLEAFASGTGIARLAALRYPGRFAEPHAADAKDIIQLSSTGDGDAREVLSESASKLGQALALIADFLNPELIVLGSLASRLPASYVDQAIEVMREETLPGNFDACRVVGSQLGERLQDLAALVVALDDY